MPNTLKQDLVRLRKLKTEAEEAGRKQKAASAAFKQHQSKVVERMSSDEIESLKTNGTLFSLVEKLKGNVQDRAAYVRWALEQDAGVQEFIDRITVDRHPQTAADFEDAFYEAVLNTELVSYREDGTALNQLVNTCIDNDEPVPPGTTFRPDSYVSQRSAS